MQFWESLDHFQALLLARGTCGVATDMIWGAGALNKLTVILGRLVGIAAVIRAGKERSKTS